MDKSKVLFDYGPLDDTFIGHDIFNPVHLRYTVTLDHEVDDELVKLAWDRTKRVYPIIDGVLATERDESEYMAPGGEKYHDEHVYLVEAEGGSNDPVKTKVPIMPRSDAVDGRLICISYWGNEISINTYHILVDGGGLTMVFRTFLYCYLALYTGHEDASPIVELREGRELGAYYGYNDIGFISTLDYTPTPLYVLPCGTVGFVDDDMVNEDGHVRTGSAKISASDFMGLCKKSGSNPSSMISTLLGKVAYALNPSEQNDIVFGLTVSTRNVYGLENSIGNVLGLAVAYATREEVEHAPLAQVAQKIRADINRQRGRDYQISLQRVFTMYEPVAKFKPLTVTYMGAFSVGENDSHIRDFIMGTNGNTNLYLMQMGEHFYLTLQYGRATQRYLDEFVRVLGELGIEASIGRPAQSMENDVPVPVV